MNDDQYLALLIACMFAVMSLFCFLGKDLGWRYELWWRKMQGFPPESLKRNPEWDSFGNFLGWLLGSLALLAVLYIAIA